MALVLGLNAKSYRNSGTYGVPVWLEVEGIINLTLSMEKASSDVSSRRSEGWRENVMTLRDANISFQMIWDNADVDFDAILTAFLAEGAQIDMWILDGDNVTTGNQGLRAEMEVETFTRNEELEDALRADIAVRPGRGASGNAPVWQTVP